VIVADDMGYSDIGPYGSEVDTPALNMLARNGVTMANYHTAPLCSPSRAALLTGINPHRAGFGHVSNFDPGFPGLRVEFGDDIVTLPETLRDNGYATFAVGKWHLVREAAMHAGADKGSWPCQRGFDHYYGSLEGLNSFFEPNQLVRDNTPLDIERWPDDYYITDDLTDQAESYIRSLRAHQPEKPFFLYFAHIAMHAPLQAKDVDLLKYKGKYEAGWDQLRRERFERQLELGLFPPGTKSAGRNHEPGYDVGAWDELTADEQQRFARYMEVYAAMVDSIDQSTGRLMDLLSHLGELENTIIVFTSDNGGSAEGGPAGSRSYLRQFPRTLAEIGWMGDTPLDDDLIGTRRAGAHYPRGWAQTSNTPFRLYKGQTYGGGVRVPLIVSWPAGLEVQGRIRHGYGYVTDLTPTLLDLAGLEHPAQGSDLPVQPMDGVSLAEHWAENTPSAHVEQYSEVGGHRGLYRDGWKLLSLHDPAAPVDEPRWQLFDVRADPIETQDLSGSHPQKVQEMARAWEAAAWHNTVFPLFETTGPGAAARERRRPSDEYLSRPVRILRGTPTLERFRSLELVQYRDFSVTAELTGYRSDDRGVLFSHGDQLGGYLLFIDDGRLRFGYNAYGDEECFDLATVPVGATSIRLDATVRDPLLWDFSFSIDGIPGNTVPARPQMTGMAPWTGISVGLDARGPVLWDLRQEHGVFRFTGGLTSVHYFPGRIRTPRMIIEELTVAAAEAAD
jgi:arylsulfatase